jgi:hypothetical protein
MLLEISALALLVSVAWLWVDSMRAREAALDAGRRACEAEAVQFLDWTVAVVKMRIDRADDGRLRIRRVYQFEFSDTGNNRLTGSVTLLGTRLIALHMPIGETAAPGVAHLH